jgi:hypothetical protein
MRWILAASLVFTLSFFTACGGCGDKLTPQGKHIACAHGCVEKVENEQKVHNGDGCSCSASCPCMAFPAKKKQ